MLDGLLGRGYSAKCKYLIKQTKSRIDVIRRKRSATLKFLKKDIADLLNNGLDINAYGRAEGLVAEIILSSCYDFVEKSCDIVLNHLSVMQKVRECPEDCREAASCLMFAAARFSDLPELRDLRQLLHDRYGNALENYVNHMFVENVTSKLPSLEKKVQLMKDIAIEFSIEWDYKAFEQRISNPPAFLKDCKTFASPEKRHDRLNNGHGLESSREAFVSKGDDKDFLPGPGVPRNGCKLLNGSDESVAKRINDGYSCQGRQEYTIKTENGVMQEVGLSGSSNVKRVQNPEGDFKMHDSGMKNTTSLKERENVLSKKSYFVSSHDGKGVKLGTASKPSTVTNHADRQECKVMGKCQQDRTPRSNPLRHDDGHDADKLIGKVHEDRMPMSNPFHNVLVPPPYVKPRSKSKDSVSGANVILSHVNLNIGRESVPKSPSMHSWDAAGTQSEDSGVDHSNKEKQGNGHVRRSRRKHKKGFCDPVDARGIPLPKPKSMRRRHSRSRAGHLSVDSVEESEIVTRSGSRRDDSRRGLQILFDDEQHKDVEQERIVDKLLIHYSKKPSSGDSVKEKGKAKNRDAHHVYVCTGEPTGGGRSDRQHGKSEIVSPPARSISLPREHSGTSEVTKVYARAASFQADRSTEARHVHPKLPDYDNLAAQFAALRGS